MSVVLLKKLGYRVVASSGRAEEEDYLRDLSAESVIARSELAEPSKPLLPERWAGVIDAVGSHTLATALAATVYDGAVAAIGLVAGRDLPTTALPGPSNLPEKARSIMEGKVRGRLVVKL